jgi:hypothetical protein
MLLYLPSCVVLAGLVAAGSVLHPPRAEDVGAVLYRAYGSPRGPLMFIEHLVPFDIDLYLGVINNTLQGDFGSPAQQFIFEASKSTFMKEPDPDKIIHYGSACRTFSARNVDNLK